MTMASAEPLSARFREVRARTVALAAPLTVEDQQVQPCLDASPTKWHLAHTTWFFASLLAPTPLGDPRYPFLFNSYYEALGPRVERARRGLLTRPSLQEVHTYRGQVDAAIDELLARGALDAAALDRLELGLHHEQQHQELILSDAKVVLGTQPLRPAYLQPAPAIVASDPATLAWRPHAGGVIELGTSAAAFAFDNERPAHPVIVAPFRIASRPLCNAEVLAFIADGGYREPRLWLSDGWQAVQAGGWTAPMYWQEDGLYTLAGVRPIAPDEIAAHLSYYEADAIARWLGARLPTEAEWEAAVGAADPERGHFADDGVLHPGRCHKADEAWFGQVWVWTASAYAPYPGFRPLAGALAEYNGKFMSGQQVLRGGSCWTPRGHVRATYRNFFPPAARWQLSGARLARDEAA